MGLKRICKKCVVRILQSLPPLPTYIWELFLHWRLGNEPPTVPHVLYVRGDGSSHERMPLESLPSAAEDVLRIVIVSDTHERHRLVKLPPGDVLLHCGDIAMSSSLAKHERGVTLLQDFNSWLEALPIGEKVVIGGNHDAALEKLGPGAQSVLHAAYLLQDSSVILPKAGIKIYGNGWSSGASHNRAWQTAEPQLSEACKDADVVMTHLSSKPIQDAVLSEVKPRLWASGHDHRKHGVQQHDGTIYVNAATMNDNYSPLQPPVVVDLPKAAFSRLHETDARSL